MVGLFLSVPKKTVLFRVGMVQCLTDARNNCFSFVFPETEIDLEREKFVYF